MTWALVALTAGCRAKAPPAPPPPTPDVQVAEGAAFALVRGGLRPVFAQGDLHVFVNPAALNPDEGLPGVAFGDDKGPHYELLGGYFAPQLIPPRTDLPHRVEVRARGGELLIRFFAPDAKAPDLDLTVTASAAPQVVLRGGAVVVLPADRATVRGALEGAPALFTTQEAGGEPEVRAPRADRLEVISPRRGAFLLSLGCPRPTLVKPVPRGSTSSFVVHVGPRPPAADPLYSPPLPAPHPDLTRCAATGTSTLTFPATPG
ncbi:MAG: hypothetical protein H6730_07900 [Deltaproteobacteria bacterium]|nr:hypothetical protein [Deltaproteobacteria bacterium]